MTNAALIACIAGVITGGSVVVIAFLGWALKPRRRRRY